MTAATAFNLNDRWQVGESEYIVGGCHMWFQQLMSLFLSYSWMDDGKLDGWMDFGWMDGGIHGGMDGWMDGYMKG